MQVKSAKLFIDDGGEGDVPVIFLHSLAGNTAQWAEQLNFVRQTNRAIAIEMRGHGRSTTHENEAESLSIEALAEDVEAVVKELGIEKFVLVGHSLGGAVAAVYAGRYPKKVAGLLLVDPPGDSTQMPEPMVQEIINAMESKNYVNYMDEYWQQLLAGSAEATDVTVMRDLHETPKATVVDLCTALFRFNPAQALNNYSGPLQIVTIPTSETPFSLHHLLPEVTTHTVTGTGHWLHMDKPALFNEILQDFLQSI